MLEVATRRAAPRIPMVVVFLAQAIPFASWTAHIPSVKAELGLSDAGLGTVLLGAPLGSILAMLVTGRLLALLGSRLMVQLTLAGYALTGVTVGLAGSPWALFAALVLWGSFQGSMDVSMNAQAITVEHAAGRPIMAGLHGAWSVGGFSGAALGAVAVGAGVGLAPQLFVIGVLALAAAGVASLRLLDDPPQPHEDGDPAVARHGTAGVLRHPTVLVLGAVALACMLCEGAAADWSAVYLRDELGASATLAGFGYAAFSATMVALRFSGDRLLARVHARTVLPVLALVATAGLALALAARQPLIALAGFAALGIGLALVVPAAFSAAGRLPGVHPGSAVAAVSALGWVGYVGGPPLIGHLAGVVTLPGALALLPVLTLAIALMTRRTRVFDE